MKIEITEYEEMARRLKPFGLFGEYAHADVVRILSTLGARIEAYEKGEVVFREGEPATRVGLILAGAVHVCLDMPVGGRCIIRMIEAGHLAGGSMLIVPQEKHLCTIVASVPCEMLTFSLAQAVAWRKTPEAAAFFGFVERQFLRLATETALRGYVMSQPTVEQRILTYLNLRCRDEGKRTITVGCNEAEFANYIGVHPVSVSRALNKLRKEGKISYRRNTLTLNGFERG